MRSSSLLRVTLALGLHPLLGEAQDCPNGITEVDVQPVETLNLHGLALLGFVPENGVLTLPNGMTFTVTDAPRFINTQLTSTETLQSLQTS